MAEEKMARRHLLYALLGAMLTSSFVVGQGPECEPGQIDFITDFKANLTGAGCDAWNNNDTEALYELGGLDNIQCEYTSHPMNIENTRYSHVDVALVAAEAAKHTNVDDGVKVFLRYDARPWEMILELKGDFSGDMCNFYPWWSGCTDYGFFASFDALEQPAGFAKTVTIKIVIENLNIQAGDENKLIAVKDLAVLGLCSQADHTADSEGEYKYDALTNKAIPTPAPTPTPTSNPTESPTLAPTMPTSSPTVQPTFTGEVTPSPTKAPTLNQTAKHGMREFDDYTTTCQHVHCEQKKRPDGSVYGGWKVIHHNQEAYGSKHVCRYNMHVEGKCGCECFDEALGFDIDLPALDYDPNTYDGGGWTEILNLNIPEKQNWDNLNDVPYDRTSLGTPYVPSDHKMVRVAYLLELDTEYVWVSFDETDINKAGIPVNYHIDGMVNNTNIYSNRPTGITPGTSYHNIKLEFWNHCYNPKGANNKLYDHDDSWIAYSEPAYVGGERYDQRFCYGSMQVHQEDKLVFAFNGWSYPSKCDIEIGYDHHGVHPDGTYNNNCAEHARKRLTVLARMVKKHPPCSEGWEDDGNGDCVDSNAYVAPTATPTTAPTAACGGHRQEHCHGLPCHPGFEPRANECFRCGGHLEQVCNVYQACRNGTEPRLNPTTGTDHCYSCGGEGQANCTAANKEKCDVGLEARANGLCYTCGAHGQQQCEIGDQCSTGTEARDNGLCYTCGGLEQEPCIVTGAQICATGLNVNKATTDFTITESSQVKIIGGAPQFLNEFGVLIKAPVSYAQQHLQNNYDRLYVTQLVDEHYEVVVGESVDPNDSNTLHGTAYKFASTDLELQPDADAITFAGKSQFARGQAPWLEGATNIQPTAQACKESCKAHMSCRYGTWIETSEQCWLSATTASTLVKCQTDVGNCHSFDTIVECVV